MADNKKGFDPKILIKNLTKTITDYGKVMGKRTEFQSKLLANQMELSQNWLWKLKEKQASPEYQMQQRLGQMWQQQQQPGVATMTPQTDVFAGKVQPQVRMGAQRYEMHHPTQKEWIYSRIQQKKRKNMQLTPKEQKFEEQYLGIREKEQFPSFQQQVNRSNALTMLKRGEFESREEAEAYLTEQLKVDVADPEIQKALEQYKIAGPEERKGWFRKPTKKKFGYTYEQREDGKWHRID